MSSLTVTIPSFNMTSSWTGSGAASTAKATKYPDISSILAGSTINSAKLSCDANIGMWYGSFSINGKTFYGNSVEDHDVKNCITGGADGFTMAIPFTYKTAKQGYTDDGAYHASALQLSNISIVIDYTLPYTACTAPTSLTVAKANAAPGETVRVSWSGAQGGTNNAISSYTVYRSSDGNTWTALQSGITNAYLDVTAPSTNGATYHYAVMTVGSVAGYNSARSTATASVKCSFTAPSVSNVKIDNGTADVYKAGSASATLSWMGTAGTNNPITKYKIQRNGADWQETTETSYSISAHATPGQSYYYTVIPIGTYSNGSGVGSKTLYTYGLPTAPASVSVSKNNVGPSEDVTLSWSGADGGSYNAITGYRIMRARAADGSYQQVGDDIATTEKSGSVTVTARASNNSSYYYRVITLGERANSDQSSACAGLTTTWTAPTVSGLKLDNSGDSQYRTPGASMTLSWSGTDGTNNAISKYEVYRDETKLGETTETSYAVAAHATAGSSYNFQVKAIGALMDGDLSSSIYVYSFSAPSAPSVSVDNASPDAGSVTILRWSGAQSGSFNPIAGYRIMRAESENGAYSQLGNDLQASVSSATVTAPSVMGSAYYYKVMTLGTYSNSDMNLLFATVTAKVYTAPTPPSSVSADNPTPDAGTSTILRWEGAQAGTNNPIAGYRVFRASSPDGNYTQLVNDLPASDSSLEIVAPGAMNASYWYKVYTLGTKNGFSISGASAVLQITAQQYGLCFAPSSVFITKTLANPGDTVTVSWSGARAGTNNPVSGYRVYRSTGGAYTVFQQVAANVSSITDTVGASGTTYSYKVVSIGTQDGFDSLDSAIVSVKANTRPGNLSSLAQPDSVYESGVVRISWDAPRDNDENIDHYQVQRRIQSSASQWGEWADLKNVTTLYFDDQPTVTRGLKFQYRVRAVDTLNLASDFLDSTQFIRNSTPLRPTIVYPANRSETFNLRPYLFLDVSPDPDGQPQRIFLSVDEREYVFVQNAPPSGGRIAVRVPSPVSSDSMHSIFVKVLDSMDAAGPVIGCEVRVVSMSWDREITRGTIISRSGPSFIDETLIVPNGQFDEDTFVFNDAYYDDETLVVNDSGGVSHQSEIEQLYSRTNSVLAYYRMNTLSIPECVNDDYSNRGPGKIGMYAAWGAQMGEIQNALRQVFNLIGVESPEWTAVTNGMFPAASVVNEIRDAIENL